MSDSSLIADEPKKDPPSPTKKEAYTEIVTVKKRVGDRFLNPVEGVPALWGDIKGKTVVYTRPKADDATATRGTEITDKGGVVWVVSDSKSTSPSGFTYWINYVEKKEKKDK